MATTANTPYVPGIVPTMPGAALGPFLERELRTISTSISNVANTAGSSTQAATSPWNDVAGNPTIFTRAPVPAPPPTLAGLRLSDKLKLGGVFNFGEVWGLEQTYDAGPSLQKYLLYCQMMALAMKNPNLDNECYRIYVDCYLPRGYYFTSSPLVIPEYVRITGPGMIIRSPYTQNLSGTGTSVAGPFYANSTTSPGLYTPTVIIPPRAHAGTLNVYVNGNSASYFFRGCGVQIGRFWACTEGVAVTIGAAGLGYAVGDFIYAGNPSIAPYQQFYIKVTSIGTGGSVTGATVFNGDRLVNGGYGGGAYALPPALQIQQWVSTNGFNVFDPARPGYFIQASTFTSAGAAGAGSGCTFLPVWAPDFAGGTSSFGGYGFRQPIQADTMIGKLNVTGATQAAYSSTYGPTYCVMIVGLNGVMDEMEVLGGQYGLYLQYANDWRINCVNVVSAGVGIAVNSSGSIEMPHVVLDTCGCAATIDETTRLTLKGMVFFEENNLNAPTYPDTQGAAVKIGAASSTNYPNAHMDIDMTLVNMGGIPQSTLTAYPSMGARGVVAKVQPAALSVAYTKSSRIKLMVSNTNEAATGTSLLPTQGFATLGSGVDASVVLEGEIDGISGPAIVGNVSTSPCDVRVWDAAAQGRAGPFGTYSLWGTTAPTSGTAGTAAGKAGPGSTYMNTATGTSYRQTGTLASPTWT